jgi:hypothetical protein
VLSIYVDYGRAFPGESLLKLIVNEEIGSTLVWCQVEVVTAIIPRQLKQRGFRFLDLGMTRGEFD